MWKYMTVAIALSLTLPTVLNADDGERVKLPADYRATYKNYLSLDRTQNPDQIIRLFANDVAQKGPGADGKFASGSVLVAEVYKAKTDEDGDVIESNLDRRIRDKFALIAVMEKQDGWGKSFGEEHKNGDWDFAAFKPDGSRATGKDINACRACHAPLKDEDHVFSFEHLPTVE